MGEVGAKFARCGAVVGESRVGLGAMLARGEPSPRNLSLRSRSQIGVENFFVHTGVSARTPGLNFQEISFHSGAWTLGTF